MPASPGAASGKVVFTADEAEKLNGMMQDTILVRLETSPEDIHGMHAAKGILTARGGMTSHAAVVARGMGRPCVSGSSEITIDYEVKQFKAGEVFDKRRRHNNYRWWKWKSDEGFGSNCSTRNFWLFFNYNEMG